MGEITKSVASYWLAVSLFSIQQLDNILQLDGEISREQAGRAIDSVVDVTTDHLGDSLRTAFHMLDDFQRGVIGLTFGLLNPFSRTDRSSSRALRPEVVPDRVVPFPVRGPETRFPEEVNSAS